MKSTSNRDQIHIQYYVFFKIMFLFLVDIYAEAFMNEEHDASNLGSTALKKKTYLWMFTVLFFSIFPGVFKF